MGVTFFVGIAISRKFLKRKGMVNMQKRNNVKTLCQCAIIAAIYVVLTWFATALGLSSGVIQVRFSEMLCILPIFMPSAIGGLTIGCILSNILSGCVLLDIIFGSISTLIGAVGTYALRKRKYLAFLPPILSNTIIVPWVLKTAYGVEDAFWFLVLTVGIGEVISVGILGFFLYKALKNKKFF